MRSQRTRFQSTRPSRGATPGIWPVRIAADPDFNPRAPRGARLSCLACGYILNHFNPRAPRGARRPRTGWACCRRYFNPRAPRGARRLDISLSLGLRGISIHAPLAGRDALPLTVRRGRNYFNPRAPRGARHHARLLRRASKEISIHAPLAGRDSKSIQNYFTHFCDKRQFLDNFTQNAAF